jgi:hypothetical protein
VLNGTSVDENRRLNFRPAPIFRAISGLAFRRAGLPVPSAARAWPSAAHAPAYRGARRAALGAVQGSGFIISIIERLLSITRAACVPEVAWTTRLETGRVRLAEASPRYPQPGGRARTGRVSPLAN